MGTRYLDKLQFDVKTKPLLKIIFFVVIVFMMNLDAIVDQIVHPEIPYFDQEHIVVGLITGLICLILVAIIYQYINRLQKASNEKSELLNELTSSEEALKEKDFSFEESQRAASIGSYNLDYLNDTWQSSEVLDLIFDIDKDYKRTVEGWLNIIHPDDREMVEKYFKEEVLAKRQRFNKEYRIVRRSNGETRWVLVLGALHFDAEGNVGSVIGTIQDITDRKQVEEALKEKDFSIEESQRAASIGSYKLDFTTGLWKSSEVLDLIFDIDESFVRNFENWLSIIHPDDREMMDKYFKEEVLAKRQRFNKEYRIVRRSDGEIKWVLGLGALHFDAEDNIVSVIGTIQDITDRKQVEEELEKLASVVRYTSELVNLSNAKGEMVFINDAGSEMLGIDAEEMTKHNIMDVIPEHCLETVTKELVPALMAGDTWEGNLEYKNLKTNKLVSVHAITFPIKDKTTKKVKYFANISSDITNRKKAEEELEILASVVRNTSELVSLSNTNGEMVFINDAASELLGIDAKEMANYDVMDAIPERWQKTITEELMPALMAGKTWEGDLEYRNVKTNKLVAAHAITFPIKDSTGKKVKYFANISSDITERKQAEDALQESEERFRALVEQSTIAIEIYEQSGKLLSVNNAWEQFWGLKKEILSDFSILDDPECKRTGLTAAFKESQLGNAKLIPEIYYDAEESGLVGGRRRWITAKMYPIFDNNGEVKNIILTYDDITERKLAEQALTESESKLRDIVNNISDAIFLMDNDCNIISWNRSCKSMYGYTEKEALNKEMNELLKTEFLHASKKGIKKILMSKKEWSGEIIQMNKNGEPLFINSSYKLVYDNNEDVVGITVLNKDVTKSRKNDIALANASILGEETERKRLAYDLHDGLGQYLSGLRMHLQVLKKDIKDENYVNLVSIIDSAIKEYRAVSHNYMLPSLGQDGLETAVRLTCERLNSDLVKINFKSNLNDTNIPSDVEMELYRIIQEAMNNALKHAYPKKIDVALSISDANVLSIKVADNGGGFDVEKKINSTQTGIGLRNMLSRVHFLKGTINIDSEIDKGTQTKIEVKL